MSIYFASNSSFTTFIHILKVALIVVVAVVIIIIMSCVALARTPRNDNIKYSLSKKKKKAGPVFTCCVLALT